MILTSIYSNIYKEIDNGKKVFLYFSLLPLRAKTVKRAIQKRSHERMLKKNNYKKAKRLRATTITISKLEET